MAIPGETLTAVFGTRRMVLVAPCGSGDALAALQAARVPVVGLDPDPRVVEECRAAGLTAFVGGVERLVMHRKKFDALLWEDPSVLDAEAWATLAEALLPGGVLLVAGDVSPPSGLGLQLQTKAAGYLLLQRPGVLVQAQPVGPVLGRYADAFAGGGKVLELGSGQGYFLHALGLRGVAAEGIEGDGERVAGARDRGLTVHQGGFGALSDLPSNWAGIYADRLCGLLDAAAQAWMWARCAALLATDGQLMLREPQPRPEVAVALKATGWRGAVWQQLAVDGSDSYLCAWPPAAPPQPPPLPPGLAARPLTIPGRPVDAPMGSLRDLDRFERQVYSQGGEDGILAAIFAAVGSTDRFYVEFGCGDGLQCNTAALRRQGWTGLLMDGMAEPGVDDAVIHKEWIDRETICAVFDKHGVPESFDLLSIDIDGNDYWIWEALPHRPRVVVIEYNANLAADQALVMPYDRQHSWDGGDYYGASLEALVGLGRRKGYRLLGCNQAGVNAFFLRGDLCSGLPELPAISLYRPPNYWYRSYRQLADLSRDMLEV